MTIRPQGGNERPHTAGHPPGPHVNGRVLCPPPSWLKQHASAAGSAQSASQSKQHVNAVTPEKHSKVNNFVC